MKRASEEVALQNHNAYYGVGGIHAVKAFFMNYVNFTGKSSRREFWWFVLFETIVGIILFFTTGAIVMQHALKVINSGKFSASSGALDFLGGSIIAIIVLLLITLAVFLPSIAITVRRFRDAGVSWPVFAGLYAVNLIGGFAFPGNLKVSYAIIGVVSLVMLIIEVLPTKKTSYE